jgi:hypothetical protein
MNLVALLDAPQGSYTMNKLKKIGCTKGIDKCLLFDALLHFNKDFVAALL